MSGTQSDTGYWAGEDIGAYAPSYDSGFSTETTFYTGSDLGVGTGSYP